MANRDWLKEDEDLGQEQPKSWNGRLFVVLSGALMVGVLLLFSVPVVFSGFTKGGVGANQNSQPVQETPVQSEGPVFYPEPGDNSGIAGGVQPGIGGRAADEQVNQVANSEGDLVRAVEKVRPAVVGVVNLQQLGEPWERGAEVVETGTGSGVVFEVTGDVAHVITNYHVVQGASQVEVVCGMGHRALARIMGADALTDLAVLEVDAGLIKGVADFGDSDVLVPGQQAVAIGNPLGMDFSQTVTAGVVSGVNRAIPLDLNNDGEVEWEQETIQTDAAINPGNSGGALINARGELIGINSLKIQESGVEGLGFAIPINDALPIIEQLMEKGEVRRPYMGVTPKNLQSIPQSDWQETLRLPEEVLAGVVVLEAERPARQSGVRPYDVILQMDDQPIYTAADLRRYLYTRKQVGESVHVIFMREAEIKETDIRLTEMPDYTS